QTQQFQQELYLRIFRNQPYQDYVRETIARLMNGELDEQLVYRKRLRRPLAEYQRNVPPHVRAARLADEHNLKLGRAQQYQQRLSQQFSVPGRVMQNGAVWRIQLGPFADKAQASAVQQRLQSEAQLQSFITRAN
ncbi:SPOR domain-containing protein, partial [Pseudomonas aeruginosa]|nr:SPOR domain-containing protein [Pseudomonas aeruginosa]